MAFYNINDGNKNWYGGELGDVERLTVEVADIIEDRTSSGTFAELVLTITVEDDDEGDD